MKILPFDGSTPIEKVLRYVIENHDETEALKLKDQLVSLVVESCTKFVGFEKNDDILKGFDITLGILSFGLLLETKGNQDIDSLVSAFGRHQNLTSLVSLSISTVKDFVSTEPKFRINSVMFSDTDNLSARKLLLDCVLHGGSKSSYDKFVLLGEARNKRLQLEKAVDWISLYASPQAGRMIVSDLCKMRDHADAETITKTFIFYIVNKINIRSCLDFPINTENLKKVRKSQDKDFDQWKKRVLGRYKKMIQSAPSEISSIIEESSENWVYHFVESKIPTSFDSLDSALETSLQFLDLDVTTWVDEV